MTTRLVSAIAGCAMCIAHGVDGGQQYINGLFVHAKDGGATELIAYAEANSRGQLRMQHASLEDAPVIHELAGIFSSIPMWSPARVLVTTERIFRDEQAEIRNLVFASRVMNVYTVAVRVVDLERRAKIDSLLKSVRASAEMPGYAFIVLRSSGINERFYPIRLTPAER